MSPRARRTTWPFPSRSHQLLLPTHEALPQSLQVNTQIPVCCSSQAQQDASPGSPARCFRASSFSIALEPPASVHLSHCFHSACFQLPATPGQHGHKKDWTWSVWKCKRTNTEGQSPVDEVSVLILKVRDYAQPGYREKSMFSGEGWELPLHFPLLSKNNSSCKAANLGLVNPRIEDEFFFPLQHWKR